MKAMKWAMDNNYVKIYPQPIAKGYKFKGRKTQTIPYVKLVIEIGNAKHIGETEYKQHEITDKICELYQYYYERAK